MPCTQSSIFCAGRPWDKVNASVRTNAARDHSGAGRPARSKPSNPDDDEEFLASLRKRAEEQRQRAREAQGDSDDPAAS